MLAVLALYARTLAFDFTLWDDIDNIPGNPRLSLGYGGLLAIWERDQGALYIPVTYTLWWLVAQLLGTPAWAYHGLNILLHAGATLACFALLRRLGATPWPAAAGAALFALHPLQAHPVSWISGGKDLLSGLLGLTALAVYIAHRQHDDTRVRRNRLILATALMALAMLAKPGAVVVPLIALLLDRWHLRTPWPAAFRSLWPALALSIAVAALARFVQPAAFPLSAGASDSVPLHLRPLISLDALSWYLRALLPGTPLSVDLGRTPARVLSAAEWPLLSALILIAIAFATVRYRRSALPFWLALFTTALLPYLGLLPFDFQRYSTVSPHYAYLALLAPALALSLLLTPPATATTPLTAPVTAPRWALPATALALAGLAAFAFLHSATFRSTESLFTHAQTVNPRSWAAPNILAVRAVQTGDPETGARLARLSLERNPRQPASNVTLGAALERLGDDPGAEAAFRAALALSPRQPATLTALGTLLARTGRTHEAERHLRDAISADPFTPQPRASLGILLARQGQIEQGLEQLRIASQLDPTDPDIKRNLSLLEAALPKPPPEHTH